MPIESYPDTMTVRDAIQSALVNDLTELFAATGAIAAGSGVLVSAADTTVGYLNGKLLAGEGIDFALGSAGADETLTIKCEDATKTNKGVAELATDAETLALSESDKIVTPANLAALNAGAAQEGLVELATDAETLVGTDTARAVTPANVASAYKAALTAKSSSYPVVAGDLTGRTTFTNTGASGEVTFTLPAGAAWHKVSFIVTVAQYLKILTDGTEKLRFLATQGAAGGYVRSNVIGNTLTIVWDGSNWVITDLGGSWLYDE